jgi:hypothetical protein
VSNDEEDFEEECMGHEEENDKKREGEDCIILDDIDVIIVL